ncbi:carboxypeptidase-like regulatory domain-containing protein [Saprospiraceae bacterium]|nr:carboxypeptidase-like regulatory domain-containing protein [Saprospiraceae bacterium]
MRFSILLLSLLLSSLNLSAQNLIKGKIIDAASGDGLAYVNIGVVGKNIGTVSGLDGTFELKIPASLNEQKLRVSMIGYQTKEFTVSDFREKIRGNFILNLASANLKIPEITINESKLKLKRLGNKAEENFISAGFGTDTLGNEIAVKIKSRRKTTYIRELNVGIAKNPYDTLRMRLNFYSIKKGKPHELINQKNIIISTDMESGILTVDLRKYNIVMNQSFFLSLEWIEDLKIRDSFMEQYESQEPEDRDTLGVNYYAFYPARAAFYRSTSHGTWGSIKGLGIAMNVKVLQ